MWWQSRSDPDPLPEVQTTSDVLEEEFLWVHGQPAGLPETGEDARLGAYYQRAFEAEQSALCLSGGGIRSAAFAVGLMQGLARYELLGPFHYLSSVSGGGYASGWLWRWLRDAGRDAVLADLAGHEPRPLRRLREGSNYVTPKVGLGSLDTWAAISMVARNIFLNWLIFGPALVVLSLLPIAYALLLIAMPAGWAPLPALLATLLLAWTVWRAVHWLPSHALAHTGGKPVDDKRVFQQVALPALGAAALIPLSLAGRIGDPVSVGLWAAMPIAAGSVIGYLMAYLSTRDPATESWIWWNTGAWFGATLGACLLTMAAFSLIMRLPPDLPGGQLPIPIAALADLRIDLLAIAGPGLLILAQLILSALFVALRVTKPHNAVMRANLLSTELDREWLARLSAVKIRPAIVWLLLAAISLILTRLVFDRTGAWSIGDMVTSAVTLISGVTAVWGGQSSATGPGGQRGAGFLARSFDAVVSVATVVFLAMLLAAMAWASCVALVRLAPDGLVGQGGHSPPHMFAALVVLGGLLLGLALAAAHFVKVNRFSLNGMYRARLARAFLGAANLHRDPDDFTHFDPQDNVRIRTLLADEPPVRLFPVINCALNIVGGSNLAWQERKAEPFIITPTACGSAALSTSDDSDQVAGAYASASFYGGSEPDLGLHSPTRMASAGQLGTAAPATPADKGISLATAMAISGAAASPNMGYHTTAATALLLTLFNVRLGAWLPNPAKPKYGLDRSSPSNALLPLMREMFGWTNDRGRDVYLSDGGHFENLGLYEMVRRRCRYILVCDAGCDPDCNLEDLGNAVRKIRIDLGATVLLDTSPLRPRKLGWPAGSAYYVFGTVRYPELPADQFGEIIYLKPSFPDGLPVDVATYGRTNPAFPHEPTTDQWFSESQFESYRALGRYLVGEMIRTTGARNVAELFAALRPQPAHP